VVKLHEVEVGDWGWSAVVPGFGFLRDRFDEPYLRTYRFEPGDSVADFGYGFRVPLRPFPGVVAVAPETDSMLSTIPPRRNGGNVDDRDIVEGTTIFLPVLVEGALFSIGDGHAVDAPGCLGRPLPAYDVWLRGEDGAPVPPGGTGEVCIRGPGLFDAYLDPWTPSDALLGDDGFRTGDQGWFDTDGDLHLAGRRANRINMAGMKFFCEEVEAVLDRHPGVARSRVSSRDHPHLGQIPIAEYVAADAAAPPPGRELTEFCKRHLPQYKIPRQFKSVAELPMTATGKVRRT